LSGRIWSRKAEQLCTSQIEASTSPRGATSRAFELSKIGLFKFPPLGAKKPFKCPPTSNDIPLLKDKFRLQSNTVHTFQREICRDDTFNLLLKTLLKELFTTKAKFYLVSSSNLAKTEKTHGSIRPEQVINLVQIPHPSKAMFKFPPSWAQRTVKCPGYARGGGEC